MTKAWLIPLTFFFISLAPSSVFAAVSSWQKSVSVSPGSSTDYSSTAFKQSIDQLASTGANQVTLIITYYQANIYTTDIYTGWNTPTDQSLIDAINYLRSKNMTTTLKIHLEPQDNQWRAYINPSNRQAWFTSYGNVLNHYAQLAQSNQVSQIIIGAELWSMSSPKVNPGNTQNWKNLIAQVRTRFSGKLSYSANHGGPAEFTEVEFWDSLDAIGIAAYFNLAPHLDNPSIDDLKKSWANWDSQVIRPVHQRWNKPILFTEVGYKSVNGAHKEPWAWWRETGANETEQANDYEALFSYWDQQSYFIGAHWWEWTTNPNAGGSNDTYYTPQNKKAQTVIKNWYTQSGGVTPTPTQPVGQITSSASFSPAQPAVATSVSVTADINSPTQITNALIDIEIYNSSNSKVHQQFFENQALNSNQTRSFTTQFSPATSGNYKIKVAVFGPNWNPLHLWNDDAGTIPVGTSPQNTPAPTITSTPPSPTPTLAPIATPTVNNPTSTPPPSSTPPPVSSAQIEIWWPSDGVTVCCTQPFKGLLTQHDLSSYDFFWSVDGGGLVAMPDNQTDYPHKETEVDLRGWTWKGTGPYTVTFTAKNKSGQVITTKNINILVSQ